MSALLVVDLETFRGSRRESRLLSKLSGWLLNKAGAGTLMVLPFVDVGRQRLLAQLKPHFGDRLKVLNPVSLIDQISPSFREEVTAFGAGLRRQLENVAQDTGGEAWRNEFAHAWWWTETSCRNLPGNLAWTKMMFLRCLKVLLQKDPPEALAYLGDREFSKVVRDLCHLSGTECQVALTGHRLTTFFGLLALRLYGCAALLAAHILARRSTEPDHRLHPDSSPVLAFSYYPRSWLESKRWGDRYYGDLLEQKALKGTPLILALGILDSLRRGHLRDAFVRKRFLATKPPGHPFTLLERWTSIPAILAAHFNPRPLFRYWKMRRNHPFRQALTWQKIDLSPVLEPVMKKSVLVDWPRFQILEACARRMARQLRPQEALFPFFEFPMGRALVGGLREGGVPQITGLQHGSITPMRLIHILHTTELTSPSSGGTPFPHPDRYLVETPLAQEILTAGGRDKAHIEVHGAARLKPIAQLATDFRRHDQDPNKPLQILVGLWLHDAPASLDIIQEALGSGSTNRWVIKPHPKTPPSELAVWMKQMNRPEVSWTGTHSDIHELMSDCDVFIGTSSSVLLEAIWLGVPVIMLRTPRLPDLSPFAGSPVRPHIAADGCLLRQHISQLAGNAGLREQTIRDLQGILPWAVGPVAVPVGEFDEEPRAIRGAYVRN